MSSDSLLERVASFPSDLTVRTVAGGRNSAVFSETDRDVLCLVLCQDLESCPVSEDATIVLPDTEEVLRGIGYPRYDSRVYLVSLEGADLVVVKEVYSIGRG